jgi:hypothetical protein
VNNLPRLALNLIFPISTSQVARITGVNHWHPAILDSYYYSTLSEA